nr:unnamed protein product [Callosobruchus analis]
MEDEVVMDLELGEEIQMDSPRREEEATAGQRRGGSTQGVALEAGDGISNVPVDDLVRVSLAGGLTSTITKIAKQQAMLVAGELSEAPVASTSSRRSHVRSRVADLAGELASDKSMAIGEGDVPRNMTNVPRNAADVPRYTAALGEAYVPGAEMVNGTDSCPKRMLTRPVNDALSQVVGSEALGPAGLLFPPRRAKPISQWRAKFIIVPWRAKALVIWLLLAEAILPRRAGRNELISAMTQSVPTGRYGVTTGHKTLPRRALRERSVKWQAATGGDLKSLDEVNGYSRGRSRL